MGERFSNMPLDWDALLGDEKVAAMSDCAFRAYMHLLRAAWHSDVPASLPNNDSYLAREARLGLEAWQRVKTEIQGCFRVTAGRWHQKRMRQVYDAMLARRKRNIERTANASRARHSFRNGERNDSVTEGMDSSTGVLTNSSPHSPPRGAAPALEVIYALYPRKVGRPKALQSIHNAVRKHGFDTVLEKTRAFAAAVGQWPPGDEAFIPHPATWFNQERYNDDPATWERKPAAHHQHHHGNAHAHSSNGTQAHRVQNSRAFEHSNRSDYANLGI